MQEYPTREQDGYIFQHTLYVMCNSDDMKHTIHITPTENNGDIIQFNSTMLVASHSSGKKSMPFTVNTIVGDEQVLFLSANKDHYRSAYLNFSEKCVLHPLKCIISEMDVMHMLHEDVILINYKNRKYVNPGLQDLINDRTGKEGNDSLDENYPRIISSWDKYKVGSTENYALAASLGYMINSSINGISSSLGALNSSLEGIMDNITTDASGNIYIRHGDDSLNFVKVCSKTRDNWGVFKIGNASFQYNNLFNKLIFYDSDLEIQKHLTVGGNFHIDSDNDKVSLDIKDTSAGLIVSPGYSTNEGIVVTIDSLSGSNVIRQYDGRQYELNSYKKTKVLKSSDFSSSKILVKPLGDDTNDDSRYCYQIKPEDCYYRYIIKEPPYRDGDWQEAWILLPSCTNLPIGYEVQIINGMTDHTEFNENTGRRQGPLYVSTSYLLPRAPSGSRCVIYDANMNGNQYADLNDVQQHDIYMWDGECWISFLDTQ